MLLNVVVLVLTGVDPNDVIMPDFEKRESVPPIIQSQRMKKVRYHDGITEGV